MLNGNDVAKLSADDLWVFHQKVVELLVARIKKRSRELDELLPQLGLGHKPAVGWRLLPAPVWQFDRRQAGEVGVPAHCFRTALSTSGRGAERWK